jgi:hypothetical protein
MSSDRTIPIRLSPTGPEIGTPPTLLGMSDVAGRVWGFQGTGTDLTNVPGTGEGVIPGLSAGVVDLKPSTSGYRYDIQASTNTYGTGGGYIMTVYGSTDGGTDLFPHVLVGLPDIYEYSGVALLRKYSALPVTVTQTINRVKVTLERNVAADANLQYVPADSALVIREISVG